MPTLFVNCAYTSSTLEQIGMATMDESVQWLIYKNVPKIVNMMVEHLLETRPNEKKCSRLKLAQMAENNTNAAA